MTANLAEILDANSYLTAAADIAKYKSDIVGDFHSDPQGVARPTNTEEVAEIMAWCHANKVPLTPQGGNTGLCGGCIPKGETDAVILTLERMNKIRDVDLLGNTIIVEAGCVLAT